MHNDGPLYTTTTKAAFLILTIIQLLTVQAYREHKVHNIVLYPDKHSWCKTTTIKQVISYPGCTSVEIDNNVCVGACFSYSIPHTEPSDPGEVIVPYCDSCQPSETTWHQITLQCNKNDADTPSQLIKHVQIIHNCSCTPCEKDSLGLAKFPENNEDFFLQQSADAELLDALQTRNESNLNLNHLDDNRSKKMHSLLNHKLITLLKSIQANNSEHDKEQLFDLFNVMQEPMKHKVKAKNIIDFIETLQSNKTTDLDTSKLTEILLKFEYPKHTYKVENLPIAVADRNESDVSESSSLNIPSYPNKIMDSLLPEVVKENSAQKENIPIAMWIQNTAEPHHHSSTGDISTSDGDNVVQEPQPQPSIVPGPSEHHEVLPIEISSADINLSTAFGSGSASSSSLASVSSVEEEHSFVINSERKEEEIHHHLHPHPPHSHQHHVNDNIVSSHGHLARGPHGALVIEPDRIHEEKLDVNAHELKPNHAGTLLSYHSHSGEGNAH